MNKENCLCDTLVEGFKETKMNKSSYLGHIKNILKDYDIEIDFREYGFYTPEEILEETKKYHAPFDLVSFYKSVGENLNHSIGYFEEDGIIDIEDGEFKFITDTYSHLRNKDIVRYSEHFDDMEQWSDLGCFDAITFRDKYDIDFKGFHDLKSQALFVKGNAIDKIFSKSKDDIIFYKPKNKNFERSYNPIFKDYFKIDEEQYYKALRDVFEKLEHKLFDNKEQLQEIKIKFEYFSALNTNDFVDNLNLLKENDNKRTYEKHHR